MDLTFGVPHGTLTPVGRESVGRRACQPGARRQTHFSLPPRQKTQLLTESGARSGTQTRSVWQEGRRGQNVSRRRHTKEKEDKQRISSVNGYNLDYSHAQGLCTNREQDYKKLRGRPHEITKRAASWGCHIHRNVHSAGAGITRDSRTEAPYRLQVVKKCSICAHRLKKCNPIRKGYLE